MFQDSMNRALKHVPGARACMLIGFDGVPIASVYAQDSKPSAEQRLVALSVEAANLLRKMYRMASDGEIPMMEEITLSGHEMTALAKVIQREYLLVLALEPHGDPDRGLKMLRLLTPWVEQEM